jgi:hypothetical protein
VRCAPVSAWRGGSGRSCYNRKLFGNRRFPFLIIAFSGVIDGC